MSARDLPYQHLSIRVPWHDTGWDGRVCDDPIGNGSCLRLKQIAEGRDDATELRLAGKTWEQIRPEELPPCAAERAGFMSENPQDIAKEHPYSRNEYYSKFKKTTYSRPAYAADCVPFRWMLRDQVEGRKNNRGIAEDYHLSYSSELEDSVKEETRRGSSWIQHADNQTLLLDTFFSAVQPNRSLVFIYAKESPLANDPRRLLIGVGRARSVGNVVPYKQTSGGFGSVIWERVISHSIRPSMEDGFLLPYHELLDKAADDRDLANLAVFVPDEYSLQFSYASEHVSHDAALALLLSINQTIERFTSLVSGNWDGPKSWLSDRLAEVWQARGPCPGLGAVLKAFGINEGALLAYDVQSRLGDNENPWPLIDKWLRDPTSYPEVSSRVGETMSKKWANLPEERQSLLQLLSRFDLSTEQANRIYQKTEREKSGIELKDNEIISNPYLLYEATRLTADPIAVSVIDRGVFPADQIRIAHPLPEPSAVLEDVDFRRVRALVVGDLENAAVAGHSLQSQSSVIQRIRDLPLDPTCPLDADLIAVCEETLQPVVTTVQMADSEPAYQLERLYAAKRSITEEIDRRRKGSLLSVSEDWRAVIDEVLAEQLGDVSLIDDDEELARQEKATALEVLATSRFSVLVGAAGTGKTTLLRALTGLPDVSAGGLLLLAPTGKARVRMQEAIDHEACTLAQFLLKRGRWDTETNRYHRSVGNQWKSTRTVIVDECSMLTEEMLDALLDSIQGVERLVLVGDPRQLPPIGVGRPFVDIIKRIRRENGLMGFPRVAASYAELTIPRRQIASGTDERADLLLAEWFSGDELSPASDEIWDMLGSQRDLETVSVRQWSNLDDLHGMLREEISSRSEKMTDLKDELGFEQSYGGQLNSRNLVFFDRRSASDVEAWQVLSPIRGEGSGVNELNRMLQRAYRASTLERARRPHSRRMFSKPVGTQEIVYGDKVMNIRNRERKNYSSSGNSRGYVANGEIGFVTGPIGERSRYYFDRLINVAFSTQPGISYEYKWTELSGDDSTPILELAYAITIHKSQGSEFDKTFVVIPNPCRPLSRELLYTALTRQREHVVILHQGDLSALRELSSSAHSETAARQTNLFFDPEPVEINGRFLEANLIHRTRNGLAVRSKSEVVIADLLYSKGIEFEYEQPLTFGDGSWKSPDFTINYTTGTTFYWEHLGMMSRSLYRRKWEQKLAWYREHGVLPHEEGGGPSGALIVTRDGDDGSISSADIETLVDELLI